MHFTALMTLTSSFQNLRDAWCFLRGRHASLITELLGPTGRKKGDVAKIEID